MLTKRGLSLSELNEITPELFSAMMVFDQFIEPNGSKIDMIKYANLCNLILCTSPNISAKGRKEARVDDWDFLGIFDGHLTTREREEENKKKKAEKEQNSIKKIGELIKKQALGKKDGK